ncbi:MAG: hypothetical protein ACC660_06050 [Acidimicrobiales bacterium]
MDTRPCGHSLPDPLEGTDLVCTRTRCSRRVVACVVYVGAGSWESPEWRIEPTCYKHLRLHEQRARHARHVDHPGVYRHRPKLPKILDWIHADAERCSLDSFSVRVPEI